MWSTYWFEITDLDSEFCGEEFLTELEDATKEDHVAYARSIFPDVEIMCHGDVTEDEAIMLGLDTY